MTNRSRGRRIAIIAFTTVIAAVLSACVSIPTSGPVIVGQKVSEQKPGAFEFNPEGPSAGADQEAILSGFITAFNGSGNYDVARQFLSEELDNEWDPRASVLVRTSSPRMTRVDDTAMEVSIVTTASVDPQGVYSSFTPAPQTFGYQFVKENGEWRISVAPDGIVLSARTFTNLFSKHALYFLDPTRQALVPDLRWFPGGTAATRIVTALLAGPPAWLQNAVGTAFPDGTQLTSPKRVPVESDVAVVNLTDEALAADAHQRQLMRVQLEASLGRVGSISSVEIFIDGTPLSIPALGTDVPQAHPQVDNRMLVLREGEFGFFANNEIAQIEGISEKVLSTQPLDATINASQTMAATLSALGVYAIHARAESPILIDQRPRLIAPSLDDYGFIWSTQADNPSSIRIFDNAGTASDIATTLPAGATIVSLAVSRDGARVAILLESNAGPRLIVTSVVRDANRGQMPIALGEPKLDVVMETDTAIDATWMDELSIATLTRDADETVVDVFEIGGQTDALGGLPNAVAIVGGNGESGLRVLSEDGVISAWRGSSWQSSQANIEFIATQR